MLIVGIVVLIFVVFVLVDMQMLWVCVFIKDVFYFDKDGGGFENKIVQVLVDEMGVMLDLVMIDCEVIYLVCDGIDKDLCDVLVGVDVGDQWLLISELYYCLGYVFVMQQLCDFIGDIWQVVDQDGFNIFFYCLYLFVEIILKYIGCYEYNLIYQVLLMNFEDWCNKYIQVEVSCVVVEVVGGGVDLVIIFVFEVVWYVCDVCELLCMMLIINEIECLDGVIILL